MSEKILLLIFSLIFIQKKIFAQIQSQQIDSVTRAYIQKHRNAGQKKIFTRLLQARNTNHFRHRLDTTQFQYAYIEESYHMPDSTIRITEYYLM